VLLWVELVSPPLEKARGKWRGIPSSFSWTGDARQAVAGIHGDLAVVWRREPVIDPQI
jgi:hypothetical protein